MSFFGIIIQNFLLKSNRSKRNRIFGKICERIDFWQNIKQRRVGQKFGTRIGECGHGGGQIGEKFAPDEVIKPPTATEPASAAAVANYRYHQKNEKENKIKNCGKKCGKDCENALRGKKTSGKAHSVSIGVRTTNWERKIAVFPSSFFSKIYFLCPVCFFFS
jgi:hypothetical protein